MADARSSWGHEHMFARVADRLDGHTGARASLGPHGRGCGCRACRGRARGPWRVPDSAFAQLPPQEVTSPRREHHADPSLKTYVFRVGPFSIGGYQTFRHNDIVKPPPVAGSIVATDARIVDMNGDEVPQSQVMLHHNVFTNRGPDAHAAVWLWIRDVHRAGRVQALLLDPPGADVTVVKVR
jgi:hypothetical protein